MNRCGRPFGGEGLRLLQERIATHEQIDRICRLGGGFRMGPFELMDLVGIDVGFEVAQSFDELSFGEPRWRPSPIQARMVAAGRLGRKSGRGCYEYAEDGSYRPDDPEPPAPGGGDGMAVALLGEGAARGRPARARPRRRVRAARGRPGGARRGCGRRPGRPARPAERPLVALCAGSSLAERGEPAPSASTCCRRSTRRSWWS